MRFPHCAVEVALLEQDAADARADARARDEAAESRLLQHRAELRQQRESTRCEGPALYSQKLNCFH